MSNRNESVPLRLLLIRHAKSSWANPLQSDFDRELNDRGKQDAPEMGKKLARLGISPDLIICSSARRTLQTAKKIAKVVDYDPDNLKCEEKLYHCEASVFSEVISGIGEAAKTVFIVAHNPGITDFVNSLSPEFTIDDMPTCGVVGVVAEAADWSSFASAGKKVFLYEYPAKDDKQQ